MKPRADYDRIAARYDHARRRYASAPDPAVRAPLLDVGCGTGSWLAAQSAAPKFGVDRSAGMLRHAVVSVVRACAEALPFADASFAWVESRFAIAHLDERAFLAEARCVLEHGGTLRIVSVLPPFDEQFAIYDVYPIARTDDLERFPSPERLELWIRDAGFEDVETSGKPYRSVWSARDFAEMIRGRTASQLDLLPDDEFEDGLSRLEDREYVDDGTIWTFRGTRP